MSQGSSFWQWYARVNDDIRTELVDRAWFGREGRDHSFEQHVSRMAQANVAAVDDRPAPDTIVRTRDPHVPDALEGIGARGVDDFNAENVKSVMEEFYGRGRAEHGYDGQGQQHDRDEAMQRFYRREDGIERN